MRSRLHKLTVEEERATVLDGIEHHIEWVRVLVEGEAVWRGFDELGASTARDRGGLGRDRDAGGCAQTREEAVTPIDILQEIMRVLEWRGPGGRQQGHIALSRAQAEVVVTIIKKGMPPADDATLRQVQRINLHARITELQRKLDFARDDVHDFEIELTEAKRQLATLEDKGGA